MSDTTIGTADGTFVELVTSLKRAIQAVQADLDRHNLEIKQADLSVKVVMQKEVGSGVKFKILVVDVEMGARMAGEDVTTIAVSFVPRRSKAEASLRIDEELRAAILAIGTALKAAAASPPVFDLSEATVELQFVTTAEGKISFVVVIGGHVGASLAATHTIKLTLKPA